jgi:tRNA(Arg) A34 adenosine deaminase TadA
MCAAALSFVGIKRIVYAALAEDANVEQMIARDLTLPEINPRLNSPYRFIINPIVDYVLDLEEITIVRLPFWCPS